MMHESRSSALDAARAFHARGWRPVALAAGGKRPVHPKWQDRTYTRDELLQHFNGDMNVGLALGERSGGLMDVDIDSPMR